MARPTDSLAEYRRKRDFTKTEEPTGDAAARRGRLRFVIQKHAASHLHYDFRLELDGVMKSWAVPKGPSLDPSVKRLAMEVEDHPIAYNTFEGTIPAGEYGGGTVMLWDRGTYTADEARGENEEAVLRRGLERGDMKFTLHGERLRGSFALVRMKRPGRPQWLLIKHRDGDADPDTDVTARYTTSVATGRTMEEIGGGAKAAKKSAAKKPAAKKPAAEKPAAKKSAKKSASVRRRPRSAGAMAKRASAKRASAKAAKPAKAAKTGARGRPPGRPARRAVGFPRGVTPTSTEPMYASVGTEVPREEGWTYEPKYDGVRVLAFAAPKGGPSAVQLVTRNGKDKAHQFPEVSAALGALAAKAKRPLVLDGEVVAVEGGAAARFQALQSRMHLKGDIDIEAAAAETPAALIAFDLLAEGDEVLLPRPWSERRARLERLLRNRTGPRLWLTETVPNDGEEMLRRARGAGWEGIIAKRMDARYVPGDRSDDWLKLKVEFRQEFVIGGFTEPRNTRPHLGALLLGYFDGDRFVYVGHTGGGFTREGLKAMRARLDRLERRTPPFEHPPKTNEPAHWVRPEVVVEVKFSEWTADGRLRQPIFLGVRDDKDAREVGKERTSVQRRAADDGLRAAAGRTDSVRRPRAGAAARATGSRSPQPAARSLVEQLTAIEDAGGDGDLRVGARKTLHVSSLDRVYFPKEKHTKGDVMRYYAQVAPYILPTVKDRPLVLKRTPEGIAGETFFQQKPPEHAPDVVRVLKVETEEGKQDRIVGGELATLLYTVQLGCISVDPWMSRVRTIEAADYTVLDLDPGPRANFKRVVEVARAIKAELDEAGLRAGLKTSGSRGLHIVVPLPARTSYESARLLAQLVATRVAERSPKLATVERSVDERPAGAVYVDYLQNVQGKSVAGAYCVRAKPGATVSTPLEWEELDDVLDPRAFTIETVPARLERRGDLWAPAMRPNPARLVRAIAGD